MQTTIECQVHEMGMQDHCLYAAKRKEEKRNGERKKKTSTTSTTTKGKVWGLHTSIDTISKNTAHEKKKKTIAISAS